MKNIRQLIASVMVAVACAGCSPNATTESLGSVAGPSIQIYPKYKNESVASSATGFFVKRKGNVFLVTNHHVVTGRKKPDSLSGSLTASDRNRPVALVFWLFSESAGSFTNLQLLLFDQQNKPTWREHKLGGAIDLAALLIDADATSDLRFSCLDLDGASVPAEIIATDSLLCYGFPEIANQDFSSSRAMPTEIKGKAKIPTESIWWRTRHCDYFYPTADKEKLVPLLLAADFDGEYGALDGVSGSPVFLFKNGKPKVGDLASYDSALFVGVYSASMSASNPLNKELVAKADFIVTRRALLELLD